VSKQKNTQKEAVSKGAASLPSKRVEKKKGAEAPILCKLISLALCNHQQK
jgi:hypothetical protein